MANLHRGSRAALCQRSYSLQGTPGHKSIILGSPKHVLTVVRVTPLKQAQRYLPRRSIERRADPYALSRWAFYVLEFVPTES